MSLQENDLKIDTDINRERVNFMFSLFNTISSVKEEVKINSIFLNLAEKLEIYIFVPTENIPEEREIFNKFSQWESENVYFPEIFIYQEDEIDGEINILPRSAFKVY